ncbi:hypothetical protein [Granulicoccus phenolivorans]|uniref:hypothetical protein n=1 Tax=Granulicoccus phenolivorans TaxID=266854 RepID=UPI000425500D|nr:hypothetical protein [Granulicoccus phenolivorans]
MSVLLCIAVSALAVAGLVGCRPQIRARRDRHLRDYGLACIILYAVCLILAALAPNLTGPLRLWLVFAVIVAAVFGGGPFVVLVVRISGLKGDAKEQPSLPGSAVIGMVERGSFIVALILGLTDVAAVLVGVKALGVYAARDDHRIPAFRVLGTLLSISWALALFALLKV